MYGYMMSIIICELGAFGIDFIAINSLSITQDIGVLFLALALGLFLGVLSNIDF